MIVRTSYDQLMKQVLQARFADFLRLFAPDIAAALDLEAGVTFRDAETFMDLPRGKVLVPDIVAEARALRGMPGLLLVHTEVQKEREREDFARRMWRYVIALALREDKPIVSIALLFYPEGEGLAWQVYEEAVFGHTIVTFRYLQISLPLLSPEDYLGTGNALAAALASVMGRRRRGAPRAQLHVACLQRLVEAEAAGEVDAATADLLADVVETYLPVSAADRAALRVQLGREGGDTMATDVTQLTWRSRVSLEVKREDVRRAVQAGFGHVSPEMEAAIGAADTEDALNILFDRALTAATEVDIIGTSR